MASGSESTAVGGGGTSSPSLPSNPAESTSAPAASNSSAPPAASSTPPVVSSSSTPEPPAQSSTPPPPVSSEPPPPVQSSSTPAPPGESSQPPSGGSSSPSASSTPPPAGSSSAPADSSTASSAAASTSNSVLTQSSTSVWSSASLITTDGQTQTVFVTFSTVLAPGATVPVVSNADTGKKESNTGAIVGGVVGGIGGLAVLIALLFLFLRWRKRHQDRTEFDGNFDPDRVVRGSGTLPQMNIDVDDEDDGMGGRIMGPGVVTPFMYHPAQGGQEMRDVGAGAALGVGAGAAAAGYYGGSGSEKGGSYHGHGQSSPGSPPPTSPLSHSGYSSEGPYPPTTTTSSSGYYPPTGPYTAPIRQPSPGPSLAAHSSSGNSQSQSQSLQGGRSTKEQEAFGRRYVVNQDDAGHGTGGIGPEAHQAYLAHGPQAPFMSMPEPERGSGVIVHQDGGRVAREEEAGEGPSEIPPTYDSLPMGERR